MKFNFCHNNINVFDLEKSLDFYQKALNLKEVKRKEASDGSYKIVFLGDEKGNHLLELTWLRDKKEPYNLGDNEIHLAMRTDDYENALKIIKSKKIRLLRISDFNTTGITGAREEKSSNWIDLVKTHFSKYELYCTVFKTYVKRCSFLATIARGRSRAFRKMCLIAIKDGLNNNLGVNEKYKPGNIIE